MNKEVTLSKEHFKNLIPGVPLCLGHLLYHAQFLGRHFFRNICFLKLLHKFIITTTTKTKELRHYETFWPGPKWIFFIACHVVKYFVAFAFTTYWQLIMTSCLGVKFCTLSIWSIIFLKNNGGCGRAGKVDAQDLYFRFTLLKL